MELKLVPQDDENMMQGKSRDVCYALDENGNYTTALSTGWEPKNIVFKQVWAEVYDKIDETRAAVISGKLSPIAYYMEKSLMDISILANYMDLPKRKVKKHLRQENFAKLSEDLLNKYAQIFNITINELKKIDE